LDEKPLDKKPVVEDESGTSRIYDIYKLKELKISGTIGGVGEKDRLSYTSLSYQIANARKLGYPEQGICAAVIKSISPSNNLRTYLESKRNLNLKTLIEVLRTHYKEKDSASVFMELSNAVQLTSETPLDFVIRLMCLRQKILDLSNEEGCPYDENLLKKRFFHAIFTGMRNSNVRVDLKEKLKNELGISDEDILKFVSEAMAYDSERNEKLNGNKKSAQIAAVVNKENFDLKEKKKENPFAKIEELKISQEREMTTLRNEISQLRNALHESSQQKFKRNQYKPREYPRRRKRCQNCETNDTARCFHCFTCGSSAHVMSTCPEKNL
jgi:hypothetical protein